MQALGAPGKTEKTLITRKVTTIFSVSPCTPISYMSFPRPTDVSRIISMQVGSLWPQFLPCLRCFCRVFRGLFEGFICLLNKCLKGSCIFS